MRKIIIAGIVGISLIIGMFLFGNMKKIGPSISKPTYRYVPIGDSYTIGNGLAEYERWPNSLVDNLREDGVTISLVANPAVSGWTTQMIRQSQIAVLKELGANVTTVLTGANDVFSALPPETFRRELQLLLDEVEQVIPDKKIVLITIPDYTRSPAIAPYGDVSAELERLEQYNDIIREEGSKRGLPVADIFPVSQEIAEDETMFIQDGLHPSGKQVELWEKVIEQKVRVLLKGK